LGDQSLQGKVIDGIASLCKKHQKPLSLLVGKNDLSGKELLSLNVNQVSSISAIAKNQEDAMLNGSVYLEALAKELLLS
jgi:glycerate kinase